MSLLGVEYAVGAREHGDTWVVDLAEVFDPRLFDLHSGDTPSVDLAQLLAVDFRWVGTYLVPVSF